MYGGHYPVFFNECMDFLRGEDESFNELKKRYRFLDLTLGAAGHSRGILKLDPEIKLVSFDQDPDALNNAYEVREEEKLHDRWEIVDSNFTNLLERFPEEKFAGILVDLGVSSHQFDTGERGFSLRFDGPLDMRMNPREDTLTAEEIINTWEEHEISELFYEKGEERFSRQMAQRICEKRQVSKITTTKELEDILFHAVPKKARFGGAHPGTRVFQALRIAVNQELDVLESLVPQALEALAPGGVFAAISFHSLEDRIVKHEFRKVHKGSKEFSVLTKKPLRPSEQECLENSRSRSAKLRAIRKNL